LKIVRVEKSGDFTVLEENILFLKKREFLSKTVKSPLFGIWTG